MPLTLRIGKNASIWEDGEGEEILRLLFTNKQNEPDLRASVYETDTENLTRVQAEHLVSFTNPAVATTACDLDVSTLAGARRLDDPAMPFGYIRTTHAELQLASRAQLLALIEVLRCSPQRRLPRIRDTIMAYMKDRRDAGDTEWTRVLESKPKWAAEVERFAVRSARDTTTPR